MLLLLGVGALGLLTACGGSDDDADDTSSSDGGDVADVADETDDQAADAAGDEAADDEADTDGGGETFDPTVVASCLADAGFETVPSSELLSEQQNADLFTMSGQTEGLTFDAATSGFAGGVTFYETPEQAAERGERLADVAKAQRVIGNALINVSAGSYFEDAVAAAEACLTD